MRDPWYADDPVFNGLYTVFPELTKICQNKKVDFFLCDVFPIQEWKLKNKPPRGTVTNSIIIDNVPNADHIVRTSDSFYGIYYHPYTIESIDQPKKKFNCFMNRMDPVRQSWLYQLIRRGLFDQGYVSFKCDIARMSWYQGYTIQEAFQDQFDKQLAIFQVEHDLIKDRVPYCNFVDVGDVTPICYDSKISLVLETYFQPNNIITYSEKIFRALQIPRPWLLFAPKHAVKNLRRMGFDVLDDIIDHSRYDDVDFCIERQKIILDVLEEDIDNPLDSERLKKAAMFNQQILKNFSDRCIDDFIKTVDYASAIYQKSQ